MTSTEIRWELNPFAYGSFSFTWLAAVETFETLSRGLVLALKDP